nr:HAMP domain-containing sensor histidine kinase [uncultured Flavobacterium sp.]
MDIKKTISLQNYTLRYLVVALLVVIAVWAGAFYAVILEEVYDNIDDGLKNSKILIVRETYAHPELLNTPEFGINQYKIESLPKGIYDFSDTFISTFEFMEYDDDDEPVRLLQTVFNDAKGNPHRLTIRASMVEEDELLEDLLTALIALYAMLVVSIALLNRVILKRAWKPFYAMMQKLKEYKPGKGNVFETVPSSVTEFRVLTDELTDLLQRNETTYANQKQFIENASHELQTPLAISLNKLELFADSSTLTEEQLNEISRISDTLNRLVRLNKSLLMLSKIENRQYAESEEVDFNALVTTLAEDFEDLATYKNIELYLENVTTLKFTMNRGLAVVLISNLIKNALTHNHVGGKITVRIEKSGISVENSGGDRPLDRERIFKRFYRDLNNDQSTGLGLSLVHSIATLYDIEISYSFNGNHKFILKFPQGNSYS